MDNRILFAAARGARVQVQLGPNRGWINSTQLSWHDNSVYRIHPDQIEYQYGPISTALRKADETGLANIELPGLLKSHIGLNVYKDTDKEFSSKLHRSLFILILAEALADDGL